MSTKCWCEKMLYRFLTSTCCWCKKMLYRFFTSTSCWHKKCYISFLRQHGYLVFGVNFLLTQKEVIWFLVSTVISCRKRDLFFMSIKSWREDFKQHDLLHHYASIFFAATFYFKRQQKLTLKAIFHVVLMLPFHLFNYL